MLLWQQADWALKCRRQSRQAAAETKRNISGASEDVKEGVDQAADVVADTAESAQQGIDDASGQGPLHCLCLMLPSCLLRLTPQQQCADRA